MTTIRTATTTVGAPIKAGKAPWAIVITPNGKTACGANWSSGTVTPIRAATNAESCMHRAGRRS